MPEVGKKPVSKCHPSRRIHGEDFASQASLEQGLHQSKIAIGLSH